MGKEKALELVDEFRYVTIMDMKVEAMSISLAKRCALICINKKIKFAYSIEWEKKEEAISKLKILKEVKAEINKL